MKKRNAVQRPSPFTTTPVALVPQSKIGWDKNIRSSRINIIRRSTTSGHIWLLNELPLFFLSTLKFPLDSNSTTKSRKQLDGDPIQGHIAWVQKPLLFFLYYYYYCYYFPFSWSFIWSEFNGWFDHSLWAGSTVCVLLTLDDLATNTTLSFFSIFFWSHFIYCHNLLDGISIPFEELCKWAFK